MAQLAYMAQHGPHNNVVWSTEAPTTGTWKDGDVCWNIAPAAAGAVMWVCVVPGTPGTWKEITCAA